MRELCISQSPLQGTHPEWRVPNRALWRGPDRKRHMLKAPVKEREKSDNRNLAETSFPCGEKKDITHIERPLCNTKSLFNVYYGPVASSLNVLSSSRPEPRSAAGQSSGCPARCGGAKRNSGKLHLNQTNVSTIARGDCQPCRSPGQS